MGFFRFCSPGEEQLLRAGQFPEEFENLHRLPGKKDDVRRLHLHPHRRDRPAFGVHVEFFPACANQFAGPDKGHCHHLHGQTGQMLALV
jgi:hypothetical protein